MVFKYQVIYCPIEKITKNINDINYMTTYINDFSFLGRLLPQDYISKLVKGELIDYVI